MKKYRRIEVNAYHRRVTVVSGEWRPYDLFEAQTSETEDAVSLKDNDACEPIEPDSPEGQLILVEAVRTLEQRLTPETRAIVRTARNTLAASNSNRTGFFLKLQSVYQFVRPKGFRFARKEK
jgi:hypothetical protein